MQRKFLVIGYTFKVYTGCEVLPFLPGLVNLLWSYTRKRIFFPLQCHSGWITLSKNPPRFGSSCSIGKYVEKWREIWSDLCVDLCALLSLLCSTGILNIWSNMISFFGVCLIVCRLRLNVLRDCTMPGIGGIITPAHFFWRFDETFARCVFCVDYDDVVNDGTMQLKDYIGPLIL